MDVLLLCTGNICRSPMAEAMLRHELGTRGVDARVSSAGLLESGRGATGDAVAAMAALGHDTSGHRSTRMTEALLEQADLVLAMAREHVREAVTLVPSAWPKTFTLKEFVRRAEWVGPRQDGQPFDVWLAKVHAGRERMALLGGRGFAMEDDVADPIGQSRAMYDRCAAEIRGLVDAVVALGWPS